MQSNYFKYVKWEPDRGFIVTGTGFPTALLPAKHSHEDVADRTI